MQLAGGALGNVTSTSAAFPVICAPQSTALREVMPVRTFVLPAQGACSILLAPAVCTHWPVAENPGDVVVTGICVCA